MLKPISETLKSVPKPPKSVTTISHRHTGNGPLISSPAIDFILDDIKDLQASSRVNNPTQPSTKTVDSANPVSSGIRISHKWPEWVGLIENLVKRGYFDGVRNPFGSGGVIDAKSCNQIRTACLNFARDRPNLMSNFMHRDMEVIAGSGCPSIDRKVVNSGKRLRAHLGIDEGNVCSSCNLRGNCKRAYMKVHGDEGGHTMDVMRLVLTYGLDHNRSFINKRVEEAIRSLTRDMVKFSNNKLDIDHLKQVPSAPRSPTQQQEHQSTTPAIIHGGWKCPKCKFLNSARNIKCMHCDDRNSWDHVQLKGDWVCIRCNFFNFGKNMRCLQCHTNPPKRQLGPGEWECDSCSYINFKRNMACLKCDHKRPKALDSSTRLKLCTP